MGPITRFTAPETEKRVRRPIQRILMFRIVVFLLSLGVLLSALSYFELSGLLCSQYRSRLAEVVLYVEQNCDADDMRRCLETGESSETYARTQSFLNGLIDTFGLDYLYLVIPSSETMTNLISATSEAERAAGETDMPLLETTDAYSAEELARYLAFWDAQEIGYFKESSDYGAYYTAVKPLRDSAGETVAEICADISISSMQRDIAVNVLRVTLAIVLICGMFGYALIAWLRRNVTAPILSLEKSARDFAERGHNAQDFSAVQFVKPSISTGNEIQSLADSIDEMATDIHNYVEEIFFVQKRADSAEQEAESMTRIAYQDPLTRVKNKAAYLNRVEELQAQISAQRAEFALAMYDLNNLKVINDTYGHDAGDKYIVGCCSTICQIYKHSPVYRIGGDEFVAILQGYDYEHRAELFAGLGSYFRSADSRKDRQPWERYSAAGGMAEYADGDSIDQVFQRADEQMYQCKRKMKRKRGRAAG